MNMPSWKVGKPTNFKGERWDQHGIIVYGCHLEPAKMMKHEGFDMFCFRPVSSFHLPSLCVEHCLSWQQLIWHVAVCWKLLALEAVFLMLYSTVEDVGPVGCSLCNCWVPNYLTVGWWFGTLFFQSVGNVIIPTDELHHFSESWNMLKPPTRPSCTAWRRLAQTWTW